MVVDVDDDVELVIDADDDTELVIDVDDDELITDTVEVELLEDELEKSPPKRR